ncbi:MAG: NnrS family protein [Gammaproteobacteria bacterium]|nr:NnrS family protein [Gammaproteobacteria bacterium]
MARALRRGARAPVNCRLFAAGFRPMFLAAMVAAVLLVPVWAAVFVYGASLANPWPPTLWHGHEMVFGFLGAAVAGFLLTAVPNWTGRPGIAGFPLAILASLWLAARAAIATAGWWPPAAVAAVDVSYFVVLAALSAPPLLRSGNRNAPLPAVVLLLAVCDAVFHWSLVHHDAVTAMRAIRAAIDIILVLATLIGGRIVPAFTAGALRGSGVSLRTLRGIDGVAIASMVAVLIVDLPAIDARVAGVVAGLAAAAQFLRLAQWRTLHVLGKPIVWILHLGYAWIGVGLALKCAALLGGYAAAAFWLHALTVGALATLVVGVMSRAALGHTGRTLDLDGRTIVAYFLLMLAGLTRVFGLGVLPVAYPTVILIAAFLWTTAFTLLVWVYAPILWSARVDAGPAA